MRAELTALQSRYHELEADRQVLTTELSSRREEAAVALRDVEKLREQQDTLSNLLEVKTAEVADSKSAMMQLGVRSNTPS